MTRALVSLLVGLLLLVQTALGAVAAPSAFAAPPMPAEVEIPRAELPWRDLGDLAVRVKGVPREALEVRDQSSPAQRQVGDRVTFWVADQTTDSYFTVEATLEAVTDHAYMFVADGSRMDRARLAEAARFFEERIYAVNQRYFGSERPAGLDGDPHVTILHGNIPGVGGYFTSVDDYPRGVHPYSNERKVIYINVSSAAPGSQSYYAILAHELVHMIHWNTNRGEQTWVKEGAAEVATEATNLGGSGAARAFEAKPDTQLNTWADSKGDVIPHYGAAYLFLSYFLERFGGYEAAADLLAGSSRGAETFDRFLARNGHGATFEDVFRDWVVANFLDETPTSDARYRHPKLRVRVPPTETVTSATPWRDRTVRQFGSDYIELSGQWSSATVRFQGERTTRVAPATARSGRYFWWSNRSDMVDTKLTRVFDLRGLSTATLNFSVWYDLEKDYDYGYVMVSRDGGLTWTTLATADTLSDDPNGNNLGNGYTGRSPGAEEGRWLEQSIDLTPHVGDVVLVRFEHVTDDAYNAPGFAVDDISIPELGYSSDAEEGEGGWSAAGFVRTDGELPQRFALQLIRFGDGITVEQVPISPDQTAEVVLDRSDGKPERAVLVVSGLTRYTTEPAGYRYSVETSP